MLLKWQTYFALCALTWCLAASPRLSQAQPLTPILVAYAGQNETAGPMWVGVERGTFRKYGLDVRMVQLRTARSACRLWPPAKCNTITVRRLTR